MACIQEIVCYNIWVDLISFHVGNATEDQFFNSARYPYFASRMRLGLPEDLLKMSEGLNDAIFDPGARERIMIFVQTMTYEESLAFLDTCSSSRFYREVMNNQICLVEDLRVLSHQFHSVQNQDKVRAQRSCISSFMTRSLGLKYDEQKAYDHFASLNENRLIFCLKIIRKLRNSIGVAASAGILSHDLLATFRMRLREFDQRGLYSLACSTVAFGLSEQSQLIADSEAWDASSNGKDHAPASNKVAHAYASGETMRSTLTFIVPIFMLLSAIPAAMAWKHSKPDKGGTLDSDLWQALASSILQLLSLITFIWPTLKNPRLSQLTWIWIWLLAGFSAVCAIASVPVYLMGPTIWSFVISFAGSLGQAVVQLQVVNAI
ncbi:hypothetical protein E8E12_002268 [Didymella heteroderae]|uniref:Uncharacterized protein n=1 Tax=Didymella heteroderae TaxID=1769908 RepID=A0A9P4WUZ0_9PLEO|nr:hypothetical protein E8E12_002268 [Didymella heteroderae]